MEKHQSLIADFRSSRSIPGFVFVPVSTCIALVRALQQFVNDVNKVNEVNTVRLFDESHPHFKHPAPMPAPNLKSFDNTP
jgi:hypothetical protein